MGAESDVNDTSGLTVLRGVFFAVLHCRTSWLGWEPVFGLLLVHCLATDNLFSDFMHCTKPFHTVLYQCSVSRL